MRQTLPKLAKNGRIHHPISTCYIAYFGWPRNAIDSLPEVNAVVHAPHPRSVLQLLKFLGTYLGTA